MTVEELIHILQEMDPQAQAQARITTHVFGHVVSWSVESVRISRERPTGGHDFVYIHGTPR